MTRISRSLRTESSSSGVHPTNPYLENFPRKFEPRMLEKMWLDGMNTWEVVMSNARSRLYKTLQCSAWTTFLGCPGPRPQTLWGTSWWFTLSLFPGELFSVDKHDLVQEIMHTPPSGGSSQPVTTLHVVQKAVPFALKRDNSTGRFMLQRLPTSP